MEIDNIPLTTLMEKVHKCVENSNISIKPKLPFIERETQVSKKKHFIEQRRTFTDFKYIKQI